MGRRDGWTFYPANSREKEVHVDAQLQQPDGHNLKLLWANFLGAIKSGKPPVADVELAHRSTNLSLLGMISLKVGRSIRWDGDREKVIDDSQANALLSREYRKPWVYPST